jgi:hypothetical protein
VNYLLAILIVAGAIALAFGLVWLVGFIASKFSTAVADRAQESGYLLPGFALLALILIVVYVVLLLAVAVYKLAGVL